MVGGAAVSRLKLVYPALMVGFGVLSAPLAIPVLSPETFGTPRLCISSRPGLKLTSLAHHADEFVWEATVATFARAIPLLEHTGMDKGAVDKNLIYSTLQ
jgi:hypothetical protein